MKTFRFRLITGIIIGQFAIWNPVFANYNLKYDVRLYSYQQDLLGEYESKLTITDKKIADIRRSVTEAQMSNMDVKLKMGEVENSRNKIFFLIDAIKKKSGQAAQTEYDALKKEFELNQQLIDQLSDML